MHNKEVFHIQEPVAITLPPDESIRFKFLKQDHPDIIELWLVRIVIQFQKIYFIFSILIFVDISQRVWSRERDHPVCQVVGKHYYYYYY